MKKIAIVTGGSSGIGRAAALMLCENGCTSSAAEARITAASST